jgi:hypothetical protein
MTVATAAPADMYAPRPRNLRDFDSFRVPCVLLACSFVKHMSRFVLVKSFLVFVLCFVFLLCFASALVRVAMAAQV